MTDPEIRKGLAGVVVDVTAISKVNPETNSLLYRGYPVQELCEKCTFEEVAYLLWHGELPNAAQLEEFQALERSLRPLDARTKRVIDELPLTGASDGCRAHRRQRDRRHRPHPERRRRADRSRAQRGQGHLPARAAAGDRRLRPAPPPRPGPHRAARRPRRTPRTSCS